MITDKVDPVPKSRPPRGLSDTPPPGFLITEGRGFHLVFGDRVREVAGRIAKALASRSNSA
jgi:hypothetical protein